MNIRALPLTNDGQPYEGRIEFNLLDPNGFRIMRSYGSVTDKREDAPRFIATSFRLPRHLRFGQWTISAIGSKTRHFETTIRVREFGEFSG